jgi:hypothetical protein
MKLFKMQIAEKDVFGLNDKKLNVTSNVESSFPIVWSKKLAGIL